MRSTSCRRRMVAAGVFPDVASLSIAETFPIERTLELLYCSNSCGLSKLLAFHLDLTYSNVSLVSASIHSWLADSNLRSLSLLGYPYPQMISTCLV